MIPFKNMFLSHFRIYNVLEEMRIEKPTSITWAKNFILCIDFGLTKGESRGDMFLTFILF